MTEVKSWVRENSTLVYFLIAQALAIGAAGVSIMAYSVRLETASTPWKCVARRIYRDQQPVNRVGKADRS